MHYIEALYNHWRVYILDYLPRVLTSLVILISFYFLAKLVRRFSLNFYSRVSKKQSEFANVISTTIYFIILLIGVLLTLEVLKLESIFSNILASAGIIGIIAGFAFKDIASNTFAGFLLNMQTPFKVNDWVEIEGNYGMIRSIGLITTSLRTVEGQVVYIPNQLIYNTTFKNFSQLRKRRVVFRSGVSYGDDLELVKRIALDEVQKINYVLKNDIIDFYFTEIGSSAYNFELRFWIRFKNQQDFMIARSEIIMRIKKRFEAEHISIAYNVTTLDFGVKGGVNLFDNEIKIQK